MKLLNFKKRLLPIFAIIRNCFFVLLIICGFQDSSSATCLCGSSSSYYISGSTLYISCSGSYTQSCFPPMRRLVYVPAKLFGRATYKLVTFYTNVDVIYGTVQLSGTWSIPGNLTIGSGTTVTMTGSYTVDNFTISDPSSFSANVSSLSISGNLNITTNTGTTLCRLTGKSAIGGTMTISSVGSVVTVNSTDSFLVASNSSITGNCYGSTVLNAKNGYFKFGKGSGSKGLGNIFIGPDVTCIMKNGYFYMSPLVKTEVRSGATLRIDSGATLKMPFANPTYNVANIWYGIQVDNCNPVPSGITGTGPGTGSSSNEIFFHLPDSGCGSSGCLGLVYLVNHSTVQDAYDGIVLGYIGPGGNVTNTGGGGCLIAQNSTIKNIYKYGVYFAPYWVSSQVSTSKIQNCKIAMVASTDTISGLIGTGIYMDSVNDPLITNDSFFGNNTHWNLNYHHGISWGRGIDIYSSNEFIRKNNFLNLYLAVYFQGKGDNLVTTQDVINNNFINTLLGVCSESSYYTYIGANTFLVANDSCTGNIPGIHPHWGWSNIYNIGVFMNGDPNFLISNNYFYQNLDSGITPDKTNAGIVDNNDKGAYRNFIQNNYFLHTYGSGSTLLGYSIGAVPKSINCQNNDSQLFISCNNFSNNFMNGATGRGQIYGPKDIEVMATNFLYSGASPNGINRVQGVAGSLKLPAGNLFSHNADSIYSDLDVWGYNAATTLLWTNNIHQYWFNSSPSSASRPYPSDATEYPNPIDSFTHLTSGYYGSGTRNYILSHTTNDSCGPKNSLPDTIGLGYHSVINLQTAINNNNATFAALPAPGSRSVEQEEDAEYYYGQNTALIPAIVGAMTAPDSTGAYDSLGLVRAIIFLHNNPCYRSSTILENIYMGQGKYDSAQYILNALSDSISTYTPSDSELITFVNYYGYIKTGAEAGWPASTIHSDSSAMQAIAHSSGSVAVSAMSWLQHYFVDLPFAQQPVVTIDTIKTIASHSIIDSIPDSLVFTTAYHKLYTKTDSAAYIVGMGDSVVSATIIHINKDSTAFIVQHPPLRVAKDSLILNPNEFNIFPPLVLYISHSVADSVLHPVSSALSPCSMYSINDSITGGNTDSVQFFVNPDSAIHITNTTARYFLNDSTIKHSIHYTAGSFSDSILYSTNFNSNFSQSSLYDSDLYYNLHYIRDSVYDSTVYTHTITIYGGMPEFITHKTVYYTIDSVADTTLYFTDNFTTAYSFDSFSYAFSPATPVQWVQLFPYQMASEPGEGGGDGIPPPGTALSIHNTPVDSNLKITISPNPFTDNLHVIINNIENCKHNSILRVVNSLGVTVQSQVINIEAQSTMDFFLNLSGLSSGYYHIEIQDAENLLYNNGFIKN